MRRDDTLGIGEDYESRSGGFPIGWHSSGGQRAKANSFSRMWQDMVFRLAVNSGVLVRSIAISLAVLLKVYPWCSLYGNILSLFTTSCHFRSIQLVLLSSSLTSLCTNESSGLCSPFSLCVLSCCSISSDLPSIPVANPRVLGFSALCMVG
jgi:hypothetical protein